MVQLIRENSNETLLPNDDTEGVYDTVSWDCTCSTRYYYMDNYTVYSDVLTWNNSQNPIEVAANDTFSLQFSEGCCLQAADDNAGTTCADVYFEYEQSGLVSILIAFSTFRLANKI